jgi:hypothetical protein
MLYALGAWSELEMLQDVETFILHIVQPRLDHIDTWEISLADLLKWGEWVKERAALALSEDAPRVPGEAQCRWCLAQATCQALYDYTAKLIGVEFDDVEALESPGTMSERQLREVLEAAPMVRAWLSAVEDHVFALLNDGAEFKGYKLVEGRSLRKWADERKAEEVLIDALGDAAYEVQLLSPAKAEKALGKKRKGILDDLITKPNGKPTLAPENDKRPAIHSVLDQFQTIQ